MGANGIPGVVTSTLYNAAGQAKKVVAELDGLLKPLGFARKKAAWNRRFPDVVEVIDIQVSKAGDGVTINAGVLDIDAYEKIWGSKPPSFVEEPACTVRARIGELLHGRDLWWQLGSDGVGGQIAAMVGQRVLPFVELMHSRQAMVQWLTETDVANKKYPLPIINLAILQGFLGEMPRACALLAEVQRKALGGWRARAREVAERMGCVS